MNGRLMLSGCLCGVLLSGGYLAVAQVKAGREPSDVPRVRILADQYPVLHIYRVGATARVRLIWGAKSIDDETAINAELRQAITFDPKAIVGLLAIDDVPASAFGECISKLRQLGVRRVAVNDTILDITGELSTRP